ncbi:MAG TPA: low molecular weight protein-tyrosine-phosphatase [Solimonas sp.]|nr:low molecular weight protein-tyrosine-phosphatase [Solimonas sp.]
MFNKILVVCTGNICRSPIAEALLRQRLAEKDKGQGQRTIASAGVAALIGYPADPLAIEVSRDAGLDIQDHRAQQATQPLLSAMDLILTLDQTHNDWITRTYPQLRGRVHKLLRWRNNGDVADPYRQGRAAFDKAFEDIQLGIGDWLKRV